MKLMRIYRLFLPSTNSLRLSAYFVLVGALSLTLSTWVVSAQAREAALSFGRELVGLADLTQGAELIHVNGEQFHYSMTVTSDPVNQVLDRFEHHCETNPGMLSQLSDDAKGPLRETSALRHLRNGVIRDQVDGRGMVVCFLGQPVRGLNGLTLALERFAETKNLTDFGRLRYSFAERKKDGRTRVVTVWADTKLNVSRMFPSDGDAQGTDSCVLPRPPRSRRLLDVSAAGVSSGLRMYLCKAGTKQVQGYYSQWMHEHGWQIAATAEAAGAALYKRNDGYQAIVAAYNESGETYVTLTETGNADHRVVVTSN